MRQFKSLAIGETFFFPAFEQWRQPDGPYVKTSPRRYAETHDDKTITHTVGYIDANVLGEHDPIECDRIEYATGYTVEIRPVPRYGPWGLIRGQSPSGYGRKIPSDYMVRLDGRLHRVYVVCFSNSGSHYIVRAGKTLYLHDYELEAARDGVRA